MKSMRKLRGHFRTMTKMVHKKKLQGNEEERRNQRSPKAVPEDFRTGERQGIFLHCFSQLRRES